jgi:hypothetical protein
LIIISKDTEMTQDTEIDEQGQELTEEDTEVFTNRTSEEEEPGGHEEVKIAQDTELKVLPDNEEEDKEEILVTDSIKRPSSTKTRAENQKQKGVQKRRKEKGEGKALPNEIIKILNRQTGEIDRMALQLGSIAKQLKLMKDQSDVVKQLQSQLRQIQKQLSQIQRGIGRNKLVNTNKKKRIVRR